MLRPPPAQTLRIELPSARRRNLDDALHDMQPDEVLRALEEALGPLESAHYVLQRGSEAALPGERPRPLEGGLSIVDCALRDPDDPTRGRVFWMGGLRLEGASDLFESRIGSARALDVFGHEIRYSGRWHDGYEQGGRLRGLARTLDVEIDEAGVESVRVWRRELVLDADAVSEAFFRGAEDACPSELILRLRIDERRDDWQWREREGGWAPEAAASDPGEPIAWATLVARWASPDPEIIEAAQRIPRHRIPSSGLTTPLPRLELQTLPREAVLQRRIELPAHAIPQRRLEPR